MNFSFKYYLGFLLLFLLVFVGCSNDSSEKKIDKLPSDEPIKIGIMYSLSDKNDGFGRISLDLIKLKVDEVNSKGGINGKQIELIIGDSKCSLESGRVVAQELISKGAKYVIGGLCSDSTIGAALVTEPNQVILFSPTASSSKISYIGDYVFRTVPSDLVSAKKLAKYVYEIGHRNIGVINEVTSFTSSLKVAFIEEFEKLGGSVIVSETFTSEDTNISKQILNLKNSNMDSLFFLAQDEYKYRFLVQNLKDYEISVPLFTSETINSNFAREGFEDFLNGAIFTGVYVSRDSEKSVKFIDGVILKYGRDITTEYSFYYLSSNYDLISILLDSMVGCDYLNTSCVRDNLYSIENYEGIIGNISINEFGDSELDFSIYTFNGVDFDISSIN